MRRIIVEGRTGKIVPYTRGSIQTSGKKGQKPRPIRTPQGVKYDASQEALSRELFVAWIEARHPKPREAISRLLLSERASGNAYTRLLGERTLIEGPYRFGLAIGAPLVRSGPRKGLLPVRDGDHDNYVKAFLDAAQKCRLVPDDSLYWYRGPCDARDGLRSGVYAHDEWAFVWRFEPQDEVEWLHGWR